MLDYLTEERAEGRSISNEDLQKKAIEVARTLPSLEDFKGSDGWLTRWKKRNKVGIRRGTNESQKLPNDFHEQVLQFKDTIQAKRREHDYTPFQVGNMDQTQCRFDMAPNTTNNKKGEKTINRAPIFISLKDEEAR